MERYGVDLINLGRVIEETLRGYESAYFTQNLNFGQLSGPTYVEGKPYSLRGEASVSLGETPLGNMTVVGLLPGEATGKEPRPKEDLFAEACLPLFSVTGVGKINHNLISLAEMVPNDRSEGIRKGWDLGVYLGRYGLNLTLGLSVEPRIYYTVGYANCGQRFGDLHFIKNETKELQFAGFIPITRESGLQNNASIQGWMRYWDFPEGYRTIRIPIPTKE
ncbi:MAG: hypothetical protein JW727_04940 [Candidatus Aenigmarchaeota archaeon]|nr:hypothetical protein [Candidatus Aenigmarchaeota archaeon]